MATTARVAAAVAIIAAAFVLSAESQSLVAAPGAAPGPAVDCLSYLVNMSDCLGYVEEKSNLSKPDRGCCPELAGLVESQPICLCKFLADPNSIGIPIDINRALKLPSACGMSTPPVSLCAAIGVPVKVPTTPSPGQAPSPSGEGMAPGGAAATSPSSGSTPGNGATTIAASGLYLLLGSATALFTTFLLI